MAISKIKYRHQQVRQELENSLKNGVYRDGDVMPKDAELARQFQVSVPVIRQAYTELVRRKWVKRVQRLGTVVTYHRSFSDMQTVGLIFLTAGPVIERFQSGIMRVLSERNVGIYIAQGDDNEFDCAKCVRNALLREVRGMIVVSPPEQNHRLEEFKRLVEEEMEVVLGLTTYPGVPSVTPDEFAAGQCVARHVGECGFRHPALVVQEHKNYCRERMYGFREGLARLGLDLPADRIISIDFETESHGRREAELLMGMNPRPDVVFGANDYMAICVYHWLQNFGLRVPEDMAVIGVDNISSDYHPFSLTSVETRLEDMGARAAEILLRRIEHPTSPVEQEVFPPHLIARASTMGFRPPLTDVRHLKVPSL